jgi:fructuronate reductase
MNISTITLPASVIQPTFNRDALLPRIVHLGFGAFHRAHQALITNEMLEKTGSNWGICEINLFGGEDLIHSLREQNHLYTVMEKGENKNTVKLHVFGLINTRLQVGTCL